MTADRPSARLRLFFAVPLPEEAVRHVTAAQDRLRADAGDDGIRWAQPEQLHYTLKFLGEQPQARARAAVEAAVELAGAVAPFQLTIGGLGAYPSDARPSVLWMGATTGSEALARIAAYLDSALARSGFGREKRPFSPHLTIARIKGYAGEIAAARLVRSAAARQDVAGAHEFTVDAFVLMHSTTRPTGSEYSVVEEFRLEGSA